LSNIIKQFLKPKVIAPVIILVILIILPLAVNIGLSNMSILIAVLLNMYYASSWNIMGGYTGLFSLGNGIFIGLGAYITASLFTYASVSPWFGLIIAGLVTGFFAIIICYPTFRLQTIYYSLASCALLSMMRIVFMNFSSLFGVYTGGSDGFKLPMPDGNWLNMQFMSKLPFYYIIIALLVVVVLVSSIISKSRTGYYLRAISANDGAAASLGVDVVRMKMKAQFISAFFSAIGGGFYCMFISYIAPNTMFGIDLSINIMIMCVVGGANTLWGPIIGAGILYTINRVATIYFAGRISGIATVIFGLILMLVVYFIPGGIVGWINQLLETARAKKIARAGALKGGGADG